MQVPTSLGSDNLENSNGSIIDPDLIVDGYLNHLDIATVCASLPLLFTHSLADLRSFNCSNIILLTIFPTHLRQF